MREVGIRKIRKAGMAGDEPALGVWRRDRMAAVVVACWSRGLCDWPVPHVAARSPATRSPMASPILNATRRFPGTMACAPVLGLRARLAFLACTSRTRGPRSSMSSVHAKHGSGDSGPRTNPRFRAEADYPNRDAVLAPCESHVSYRSYAGYADSSFATDSTKATFLAISS